MSEVNIIRVDNEYDKLRFIKLGWKIYKNDPYWVPPLIFDIKNNLDKNKNPFFKHADAEFFIAMKDGKPVGRIAGIINKNHNDFYNDKTGFWGFFECINDNEVSKKLFDEVKKYLSEKGMDLMRGPVNLSTNDEVGLLIDGFNSPPVLLMTYNPKYYINLIEDYGFQKVKDLYAFLMTEELVKSNKKSMEKLDRVSDIVIKKENIKIRKINISDFENELIRVMQIYNKAWEANWGFVPMTEDEFRYVAKSFKAIIDKDLVYFAEANGMPVAFSLAVPDYNIIFKKVNGRLFPFGIFKYLFQRNKIRRIRLITLGVIKEYQKKGIDAVFIRDTIKDSMAKKYNEAEISWVLEDNITMVQTAKNLGARHYKTYRVYDFKL